MVAAACGKRRLRPRRKPIESRRVRAAQSRACRRCQTDPLRRRSSSDGAGHGHCPNGRRADHHVGEGAGSRAAGDTIGVELADTKQRVLASVTGPQLAEVNSGSTKN